MNRTSVVLADDHVIVRNGIRALLEHENDIQVIGEASNGWEALETAKTLQPDVLIIDIRMPELNGLEATAKLPEYAPHTKALILSMHNDEEYILQSVNAGAAGYVLKDADQKEFVRAIHSVAKGEKYFSGDISGVLVKQYLSTQNTEVTHSTLTPETAQQQSLVLDESLTKREKEILQLIVAGVGNKEIADQLKKSIRTIETHRYKIMKKMGVNNVVDLLKKAENLRF